MGSHRVRYNWATFNFTWKCIEEINSCNSVKECLKGSYFVIPTIWNSEKDKNTERKISGCQLLQLGDWWISKPQRIFSEHALNDTLMMKRCHYKFCQIHIYTSQKWTIIWTVELGWLCQYSLGISDFLEYFSNLSHSITFLFLFANIPGGK